MKFDAVPDKACLSAQHGRVRRNLFLSKNKWPILPIVALVKLPVVLAVIKTPALLTLQYKSPWYDHGNGSRSSITLVVVIIVITSSRPYYT